MHLGYAIHFILENSTVHRSCHEGGKESPIGGEREHRRNHKLGWIRVRGPDERERRSR